MILKKLVFLLLVFYGAYAAAEEGLPIQNTPIEHPYFWKVEKDGNTSYLLGSIHQPILKREMIPVSASLSFTLLNSPGHKLFYMDSLLCSDEIENRLEDSDLLFVEIDSFSKKSREAVAIQEQWMQSEDDGEFQALSKGSQKFLLGQGVSPQLNLYGYNVVLDNLCKYGFKNVDGLRLDEQITLIAHSKGIPVQELDDFNEKYDHFMKKRSEKADRFNQLSNEQLWEVRFGIDIYISHFYDICPPQGYLDMMERYISGRGMEDILMLLEDLPFSERWKTLFEWKERNVRWLNHFEEAHKDYDRIFVAGGLAHFVEPVSLTTMLEERGYTVEPVSCEQ